MYTCKESPSRGLLNYKRNKLLTNYDNCWANTEEEPAESFQFSCMKKIVEILQKHEWYGIILEDSRPILRISSCYPQVPPEKYNPDLHERV